MIGKRDLLISDKERMRRERLPYGRHGSGNMLQDTPSLHIFVMMDAYFAADQGKVLEQALRIFDKQMKDTVSYNVPNDGAEDDFNQAIFEKNWSDEQLAEIKKIPALLFLTEEITTFDPSKHEFTYLSLDGMMSEDGEISSKAITDFFKTLSKGLKSGEDIKRILQMNQIDNNRKTFWSSLEAKPGIWGFKIDVKKMLKMRRPKV
jgi:hypothetical protein